SRPVSRTRAAVAVNAVRSSPPAVSSTAASDTSRVTPRAARARARRIDCGVTPSWWVVTALPRVASPGARASQEPTERARRSSRRSTRCATAAGRSPTGSGVEAVQHVGVLRVHHPALELQRRGELLALGGPLGRQQLPGLHLLGAGEPLVRG